MARSFVLPPMGFGPGSQPGEEDGAELDYMVMPSGMRTFQPNFPSTDEPAQILMAINALRHLGDLAGSWTADDGNLRFDLPEFDSRNARAFADALGEGEIAVRIDDTLRVEAQESVFAGVWRICEVGKSKGEYIEIGAVPNAVFASNLDVPPVPPEPGPGVVNGPFLLTEILEQVNRRDEHAAPHVVNLTLMPHTPEDLDYLAASLGTGPATFLSRGYGNCRIEATAYPTVWRVRYYNSQDALILDTIEVSKIPEVACAAPEDIRDSAMRLAEVAEAMS